MAHQELQDEPGQESGEQGEDDQGDDEPTDIEFKTTENNGGKNQRDGVGSQAQDPRHQKARHTREHSGNTESLSSP